MTNAWHPRAALNEAGAATPYIPHPAPNAAGNEETPTYPTTSNMGSTWSLLKTLIIPAIISLILYLLLSFVVVPIWKRYRARYGQYLPLETISNRTTSLRQRAQAAAVRLLLPSSWSADFGRGRISAQDGATSDFDEDDGEELFDVDDNRREALSLDARRGRDDDGRRLSRDLEEGFKDDSDDDDDGIDSRVRTTSR
ncbi:checkpoint hus1 protein [Rutstroemia sp. NJR-2017a BBW]|nr:checkpoint hus1 protein [Rutstroemia sp. NJR-2017a BBW]